MNQSHLFHLVAIVVQVADTVHPARAQPGALALLQEQSTTTDAVAVAIMDKITAHMLYTGQASSQHTHCLALQGCELFAQ